MKNVLLLLFFVFCFKQNNFASHYMGADMWYECTGTCTYRIYHSIYLDCMGAATQGNLPPSLSTIFPAPVVGIVVQPSNCPPPTINTWTAQSYQEVTPLCPSAISPCDVGSAGGSTTPYGVAECIYYADINTCGSSCTSLQFTWSNCCRNYAITAGQGGQSIFLGSLVIDLTSSICNNSPTFLAPPISYICTSVNSIYQGASDPDGDSLSYSLGSCYQTQGSSVSYNTGFFASQPLGPGWNVNIDPITGIVYFAPLAGGGGVVVANMCIYVTEWRKIGGIYIQIGQISRDIQVTSINCAGANDVPHAPATSANTGGITNITNGVYSYINNPIITVSPGATLDFDISIEDADAAGTSPTQSLTMTWLENIAGLTFSNANNPLQVDTITGGSILTGHVNWTAPLTGTYQFIVNAHDNSCPIPGNYSIGIILKVDCSAPIVNVTGSNCSDFHFNITNGTCMTPPFVYSWSGISPTSNANGGFDYTVPSPGLYPYSLSVTDVNGQVTYYSDTLDANNNAIANAGPDITLCSGTSATLGTPAIAGYSYQWTSNPTNYGFNGPTNIAQPNVSLLNQSTIPIPVTYTLTATDANGCTATDDVLVNFIYEPNSPFVIDTTAIDSCLALTFVGTQYPNAVYWWQTAGSAYTVGVGAGPFVVCYDSAGTYDLGLWVEIPGSCNSDTTTISYSFPPTASFKVMASSAPTNAPVTIKYTGIASNLSTFNWNFDGGTILSGSGEGPYQVSWANTGVKNVQLTVVTPNYPTVSAFDMIEITSTTSNIAYFNEKNVIIFPNPAHNSLNIRYTLPEVTNSEIQLVSATGQSLKKWTIENQEKIDSQVDISHLTEGIYFVLIKAGDKVLWYKWQKE